MFAADVWAARNTLTQMMQSECFNFTTRVDLAGMKDGVHAGLAMFEQDASGVQIVQTDGARVLSFFHLKDEIKEPTQVAASVILLRVHIDGESASYSYSLDNGHNFESIGDSVRIKSSWWQGSRPSLFAYRTAKSGDAGHVDFDWVHVVDTKFSGAH